MSIIKVALGGRGAGILSSVCLELISAAEVASPLILLLSQRPAACLSPAIHNARKKKNTVGINELMLEAQQTISFLFLCVLLRFHYLNLDSAARAFDNLYTLMQFYLIYVFTKE